MRANGSGKLVLVGFVAAMSVGAMGCAADLSTAVEGMPASNNARVAVLATQGGKGTKTSLFDTSKANYTNDGKLNLVIASSSYHDLKDLMPSSSTPNLYFNSDATAFVKPQPDADGNGIDDTFFVVTEQNLPGQRLERGIVYSGPYTDGAVIKDHYNRDVIAKYTGLATVMGTIGENPVQANGNIVLDADFGAATVRGEMTLTGASQFDSAVFISDFTQDWNDYKIKNVVLRQGGAGVTDPSQSSGVGSFIGKNGQGTMGAFSLSSPLAGTGEIANIQGHYIGSADSLK
jgi:hypothetical protein